MGKQEFHFNRFTCDSCKKETDLSWNQQHDLPVGWAVWTEKSCYETRPAERILCGPCTSRVWDAINHPPKEPE